MRKILTSEMRKWSPTSSFFRQLITHAHHELNLLVLYRTIQRHANPMGLIHVPAGEDARFLPEGADQSGITFQIHHTDFAVPGQTQIFSRDVHNDGKLFAAPLVPEDQEVGIFGEEILSGSTVGIR